MPLHTHTHVTHDALLQTPHYMHYAYAHTPHNAICTLHRTHVNHTPHTHLTYTNTPYTHTYTYKHAHTHTPHTSHKHTHHTHPHTSHTHIHTTHLICTQTSHTYTPHTHTHTHTHSPWSAVLRHSGTLGTPQSPVHRRKDLSCGFPRQKQAAGQLQLCKQVRKHSPWASF